MNQSHKSDDYQLTQLSRSGQSGFESFKGVDERYYFHFNDASGKALLFSQAYIRETDCENGLQSVMRNAAEEKRFTKRLDTEGSSFFILRAGNKQEIARSRAFSSVAELEKNQAYFRSNLTLFTQKKRVMPAKTSQRSLVIEQAEPMPSVENVLLETENTDLKNKVSELENRVASLLSAVVGEDTNIVPARQVFRIELYPSLKGGRLLGKIHHVLSGDVQPFSGLDNQAISDFMASKLGINDHSKAVAIPTKMPQNAVKPIVTPPIPRVVAAATRAKTDTDTAPTQITDKHLPPHEVADLTVKNLNNPKGGVRANQPFEVSFYPKMTKQQETGDIYQAQLYVYSFGTRERFLLLEKEILVENELFIAVNVPSNALQAGSYRLTLMAHLRTDTSSATRLNRWHGTTLIQVF